MKLFLPTVVCILLASQSALSQKIEVSRSNKTIAVTVTDSATMEADTAILELETYSYGASEDDAYVNCVARANKILDVITSAGVAKQNIETKEVAITQVRVDPKERATWPNEKRFSARQRWSITVSAEQAQGVVDLAMQNGATQIGKVDWQVKDGLALEAKAREVALAHARAVAAEMAKGLGANLGELVYGSNTAPPPDEEGAFESAVGGVLGGVIGGTGTRPRLKLFPEKVTQSVTVHAVFSIN
jgi:uncharacterized protein YggE